jgi:hypothetical protein
MSRESAIRAFFVERFADSIFQKALCITAFMLLAGMALLAQPAFGSTYYVSTGGVDTNAGTISSPWRTIQHAANTVKAAINIGAYEK